VSVVTLLTDFGGRDTYVAQMKGAILAVASEVQLVDLTHDVPPQDVRSGAFHLMAAVTSFPPRTFHLAIVDPGVGTARRAIAIHTARGDYLVGPDNGLLSPAAQRLGGAVAVVELDKERYWRPTRSRTFHGRDIFAPVIGYLARGARLEEVGSPIADFASAIRFPEPKHVSGNLEGEVIHVDRFGNLVTNIPEAELPAKFSTRVRGQTIHGGAAPHYQAVPAGNLVALVGSMGLLEIAVRDGNAATHLGASIGDPVRLVSN
jgi:S-adenosylmethionine hydrolase